MLLFALRNGKMDQRQEGQLAMGVLTAGAGFSLYIPYEGFELGAVLDTFPIQTIIEPSMFQ